MGFRGHFAPFSRLQDHKGLVSRVRDSNILWCPKDARVQFRFLLTKDQTLLK
jgi:hypothetical protein